MTQTVTGVQPKVRWLLSRCATSFARQRFHTSRHNSQERSIDSTFAYAILPNYERGTDFKSNFDQVTIIGAPFANGQPFLGPDDGPQMLRNAGLHSVLSGLRWRINDTGDLALSGFRSGENEIAPENRDLVGGPCNQSYAVGKACEIVYNKVQEVAATDAFPLVIGGDHSLGMGIVSGVMASRPDTAVIWVDAHADVNTPATSGSGNMHGMPVAFFTENGIPYDKIPGCEWLASTPKLDPKNLVYIGLRDVDVGERRWIANNACKAFTMSDVDKYGIGQVLQMALDHLLQDGPRPIHLSFDIDSVDPSYAPSTGTAVRGGLTYREAHFCAEAISDSGSLSSMDIVEVNPTLNPHGAAGTVSMALGIVASAFGARIL